MDRNGKSDVKEPLDGVRSQHGASEEDDESRLLLPSKKGGLLKKSGKPRMKVQWNDRNGNNLAEVLEFQPSDVSDTEEEDADSCFCIIM